MEVLVFIIVCLLVGGLGSVFTSPAILTWYVTLNKPIFSPPNFLFAPVWTTLYVLMGVAAYFVWKAGWEKKEVRTALYLFALQLFLNGIWSPVFFSLQAPLPALIILLLLWLTLLLVIIKFRRISVAAAWLMLPYILWVTFAAVLNYSIVVLNP